MRSRQATRVPTRNEFSFIINYVIILFHPGRSHFGRQFPSRIFRGARSSIASCCQLAAPARLVGGRYHDGIRCIFTSRATDTENKLTFFGLVLRDVHVSALTHNAMEVKCGNSGDKEPPQPVARTARTLIGKNRTFHLSISFVEREALLVPVFNI